MEELPGETGEYIHDHGYTHVCDIPVEAAVEWVKNKFPETYMSSHVQAKDLTLGKSNRTDATSNGWLNKLFIIVSIHGDYTLALNNHDGRFSIMRNET